MGRQRLRQQMPLRSALASRYLLGKHGIKAALLSRDQYRLGASPIAA